MTTTFKDLGQLTAIFTSWKMGLARSLSFAIISRRYFKANVKLTLTYSSQLHTKQPLFAKHLAPIKNVDIQHRDSTAMAEDALIAAKRIWAAERA